MYLYNFVYVNKNVYLWTHFYICIYVCVYFFMYVRVYTSFYIFMHIVFIGESTICCRCIFLTMLFMFMISISIGPDAGVSFLNARVSSSNSRYQVVDKSKLVLNNYVINCVPICMYLYIQVSIIIVSFVTHDFNRSRFLQYAILPEVMAGLNYRLVVDNRSKLL
jgi:hypothetical protein